MGDFNREMEAYSALQHLLDDAQKAKSLFERAGLSLPDPLARLLNEAKTGSAARSGSLTVPPIEEPPKPAGVGHDWVWVPIEDAITITLVKAILGKSSTAMRPRDIADQVLAIRPNLSTGGIYNSGRYLEGSGVMDTHRKRMAI